MFEKSKKRVMKGAMKLMMNERVAKTLMQGIQMKNEMNETLSRAYALVQLPSLADHQSLDYALDSMRRKIKGLEKEFDQAQDALARAEEAISRLTESMEKKAEPKAKATPKKKPAKAVKKAAPKKAAVKKAAAKPNAKTAKKPAVKKAAKKSPAKESNIKPLGATDQKMPKKKGALLDLNFKK